MQCKDDPIRADPGVYVGHLDDSNEFIIYMPKKNEFTHSANVRFYEMADDIFSVQRTPLETDSLQEVARKMENFHQSETTVI